MSERVDTDDLLEATDLDVHFVAIVWKGDGRPRVQLGGCNEFEASGLLRAAILRLDDECADRVDLEIDPDGDSDDPDLEDEDDEDEEPA